MDNTFAEDALLIMEEALIAYNELAQTLPEFLAATGAERYEDSIIRAFRGIGIMFARTLAIANRTLDDVRLAGRMEDPDLVKIQPLMRMLGESFLLLGLCQTKDDMFLAPLADPSEIQKLSEHSAVSAARQKYGLSTKA